MRFRSSRRAVRRLTAALCLSVAPVALIPSLAQDYVSPPAPEVSRAGPFYDTDNNATPLELHPDRMGAFDTANTLPEGTLMFHVGQKQTNPEEGSGTGNQTYFGGGRYAFTDRLTVGLDFWTYEDPPARTINGRRPHITMEPLALSAKFKFYENGFITASGLASVEGFGRLRSPLFNGHSDGTIIGSLKAPVTMEVSPRLQFHVTPSVSFFPDDLNGAPFYGTVASIGGGASYRPSNRLMFYGSVELPFGSGGNTIDSSGDYVNTAVWTVGGRYNVTPRVALDAFLTNSVGMSPATGILTHFPDGDMPLLGIQLSYTPGESYRQSYRGRPAELTERQQSRLHDGLTLGSPGVLQPFTFAPHAWYGTDDNYGIGMSFGIDRDFGADVYFERYSLNDSADPSLRPTEELRYMFGPKLRFLDQNNGDPFSLSGRLLFGRQIEKDTPGVGVFYLEGMASYDVNSRLTISANPRAAAFGKVEMFAVGGGVNYELFRGLELIGEASAVFGDGEDATWAAGLRYSPPGMDAYIDVSASNAIGDYGIGTMVAQDDPRYSVGISTTFSLR